MILQMQHANQNLLRTPNQGLGESCLVLHNLTIGLGELNSVVFNHGLLMSIRKYLPAITTWTSDRSLKF